MRCAAARGASRRRRLASGCLGLAMAAAAAAGEFGCSRSAEPESSPGTGRQLLTEVTRAWGVPADPAPWPDGTYRIPEITCAGVALLDVEGDGDLDIYL